MSPLLQYAQAVAEFDEIHRRFANSDPTIPMDAYYPALQRVRDLREPAGMLPPYEGWVPDRDERRLCVLIVAEFAPVAVTV